MSRNLDKRPKRRILLAQLGSFGDCLYATSIAKQIKIDDPQCHLTWAIGSIYKSVLAENPDVDAIWEFPIKSRNDLLDKWQEFEDIAVQRKTSGEFDEVYFTQVYPNNIKNFDGTLRASIFRAYPRPITTSIAPIIQLSPDEIANVAFFVKKHNIRSTSRAILFECTAHSGQSFVSPEFALQVAYEVTKRLPDVTIIMSSNVKNFPITDEHLIDGSELSFRENAELTKYCSLFVGCSSGISWLCTSEWAKKLPTIQLLKKSRATYASMIHDHEYFGLPTSHIIEITDCSASHVVNCIEMTLSNGIITAKSEFGEKIQPNFHVYLSAIFSDIKIGNLSPAYKSLYIVIKRYGLAKTLTKCSQTIFQILFARMNRYFERSLQSFYTNTK